MKFFEKLHARLGDFWWYSLMLFMTCRAADLLNAFVGLWLVPKYMPPAELGAVLPLANFANCLALPLTVFAATFRTEISGLAIRQEFGKLKTLMRSVFIATGVFLVLALAVSHVLLPRFLERIRIVEGSLGLLILFSSFAGALAPIYGNTLQALKKFRETSLINFLSAPLRLVTMLLAMPLRPIAGYFTGQAAPPLFTSLAAVFALRREWAVPARPYWTRDVVRRFGRLLLLFGISGAAGAFCGLAETTVLRQRLAEIDSAAYYMVTRFSDISSYLYSALVFAIFPFSADLVSRGKDVRPLLLKASAATTVFCSAAAILFTFAGRTLLGLLPHGNAYADYWWAIPWIIGINAINFTIGLYTTAEIAANRFGYLRWMAPLMFLYPLALLAVTGRGYFAGFLPEGAMAVLADLNVTTLKGMLWWMTAIAAAKMAGVVIYAGLSPRFRTKSLGSRAVGSSPQERSTSGGSRAVGPGPQERTKSVGSCAVGLGPQERSTSGGSRAVGLGPQERTKSGGSRAVGPGPQERSISGGGCAVELDPGVRNEGIERNEHDKGAMNE